MKELTEQINEVSRQFDLTDYEIGYFKSFLYCIDEEKARYILNKIDARKG